MRFTIVLEERALREIKEANTWYCKRSIIAAENFQKEIFLTIESLKSPLVEYRKVLVQVRILPLKIFPYNIYFIKKDTESTIQIIAVLHNKRDSSFVVARLLE